MQPLNRKSRPASRSSRRRNLRRSQSLHNSSQKHGSEWSIHRSSSRHSLTTDSQVHQLQKNTLSRLTVNVPRVCLVVGKTVHLRTITRTSRTTSERTKDRAVVAFLAVLWTSESPNCTEETANTNSHITGCI